MNKIKYLYDILPYIVCVWIILNILGNMIKMTFKIEGKYIIWILLPASIIINFIFLNFSFESFFVAFITFSFSVSSYDLVKYYNKVRKK